MFFFIFFNKSDMTKLHDVHAILARFNMHYCHLLYVVLITQRVHILAVHCGQSPSPSAHLPELYTRMPPFCPPQILLRRILGLLPVLQRPINFISKEHASVRTTANFFLQKSIINYISGTEQERKQRKRSMFNALK